MTKTIEIDVKVAQLTVDRENARHPAMNSEQEALEWMMAKKGSQILKLAADIAQHGLSPLERILVIPSPNSKTRYIVMEGNRRVTALSMLTAPKSAPDGWARKFEQIIEAYGKANIPTTLTVVLTNDEEEALRLINLRHRGPDGGVGLVKWGTTETARADQRRNRSTRYASALALIDYAKSLKLLGDDTKKLEEMNLITTIDRMIKDKQVAQFFGLSFSDGGMMLNLEPNEVNKGVTKFLSDLVNKKINVRDLINADARTKYIAGLGKYTPNKHSVTSAPIEAAAYASNPSKHPAAQAAPDSAMSVRYSANRKKLINTPLSIKNKRLNALYKELKSIEIKNFPMSTGCALRAFIEGSCDEYIDKKKIAFPHLQKTQPTFREKAKRICSELESNGKLHKNHAQEVRKATSNDDSVASITSLHAFLHSHSNIVHWKDLILIWDGTWEEFIKAIYLDLK